MKTTIATMGIFASVLIVAACGSTDTRATTSASDGGGGQSAVSSSSTGAGGDSSATGTGSGIGSSGTGVYDLVPWTRGLEKCDIADPYVANTSTYSIALQKIVPDGKFVKSIHVAVSIDDASGPNGATGGPFTLIWATVPKGGEIFGDSPSRIFGEKTLQEADVTFDQANGHVGFATVTFNPALELLGSEDFWFGERLVHVVPPSPSNNVMLCESPKTGALNSFVFTGTCPGADCAVVEPMDGDPVTAVLWVYATGE